MNIERLRYLLSVAEEKGDRAAVTMLRARIRAALIAQRTPGGLVW